MSVVMTKVYMRHVLRLMRVTTNDEWCIIKPSRGSRTVLKIGAT